MNFHFSRHSLTVLFIRVRFLAFSPTNSNCVKTKCHLECCQGSKKQKCLKILFALWLFYCLSPAQSWTLFPEFLTLHVIWMLWAGWRRGLEQLLVIQSCLIFAGLLQTDTTSAAQLDPSLNPGPAARSVTFSLSVNLPQTSLVNRSAEDKTRQWLPKVSYLLSLTMAKNWSETR